jgi:hypothetical protein
MSLSSRPPYSGVTLAGSRRGDSESRSGELRVGGKSLVASQSTLIGSSVDATLDCST